MSKSILIIGNFPPPFGGVPRHIEYLAPFLAGKGWDVHVLSGGGSGTAKVNGFTVHKPTKAEKMSSLLNPRPMLNLIRVSGLRSFFSYNSMDGFRYMAYTAIGRKIIKEKKIGIISAYNLYSYAIVGALLSEEFKIPLVVTNFGEIFSHGPFFERHPYIIPYVCERAGKLLAMSRHCADSYKLLGLSPEVESIPYGVDINRFSPASDGGKVRSALGISPQDWVVLYVGRLTRDMGLHTLLEAIPRILRTNKGIRFLLSGEKGDLLPAAMETSAAYKDNVFVIPSVSFEELPAFYAAVTLVVAPTQGDRACGSLAAIEAMATGKPVIASRIGGIPEIVKDGETGVLISPNDPQALADSITALLEDPLRLLMMGKMGRQRVEEFFDESRTDALLERIFERIRLKV